MAAVSYFAVQLRGPHSGTSGHDSEAAGTRNWLQNHGPRAGLDEGQEKGKFTLLFQTLTVRCFVLHNCSRVSMVPRSRARIFSCRSG
jgi:hypothetical protein